MHYIGYVHPNIHPSTSIVVLSLSLARVLLPILRFRARVAISSNLAVSRACVSTVAFERAHSLSCASFRRVSFRDEGGGGWGWLGKSRRWAERGCAGLWIYGGSLLSRHKAHIMNAGVSGFKNAFVTKGIVLACGFISLVLAARGDAKQYRLSYQRLELWRLVMAPWVFPSLPELVFGLYLLYFFRVFERQVGSTKYMFFVIFTTTITTLLELIFLFVLKGTFLDGPSGHSSCSGDGPSGFGTGGAWRLFPTSLICWFSGDLSSISNIRLNSGPFGVIFSSFVFFFFDIPVSTRFKLLGAEVSEKSFVYFVGLQLLLWSWMQSLIPGVCGVIAGLLYRYDVAGVQEIGFSPGAFRQMAWRLAPFFSGISPEMASRMNFSRITENDTGDDDQHENGVCVGARTVPVTEDKVFKLVALGHNQKDATVALSRCQDDVEAAEVYLRERNTGKETVILVLLPDWYAV